MLRFKQCTIMLDCGLDETTMLNFLPLPLVPSRRLAGLAAWTPKDQPQVEGELRECAGKVFIDSPPEFCPPQTSLIDFSELDAILVSNYTSMLALPFIVAERGFRGTVYATEPTLQIGRLCMDELLYHIEQTPRAQHASHWKRLVHLLPAPLCHVYKPKLWRQLYNADAIAAAMQRVHTVGYGEKMDVFGALRVMPSSSGYCLGSANWTISSEYEKIVYVNGSSTLTTHPKQLEQAQLRGADVLILNGLTQVPSSNPDAMIGEFCAKVTHTVKAGGNVLVPCCPSGIVYDLIECLAPYLDQQGLSQVPLFFVSPVAEHSLAYSNILAEWLSHAKQVRVYLPEDPFPHGHLVSSGRLRPYKNLQADGFSAEFRQPCVVFAGHPSLRFGDTVHFMELWGGSSANAVIFTSPDFPYLECLAPYQPLAMNCYFTPIDTSLYFSQANKLIRDLKPQTLLMPAQYAAPAAMAPHRTDCQVEADCPVMTYRRGDVLTLPVRRAQERVVLSAELSERLNPVEVRPGVAVATVTGLLHVQDNRHRLEAAPEPPRPLAETADASLESLAEVRPRYHTYGAVHVPELLQRLTQHDINDAKVRRPTSRTRHVDSVFLLLSHVFFCFRLMLNWGEERHFGCHLLNQWLTVFRNSYCLIGLTTKSC